ncbi:MAG: molybdenum cofactor biosynthesis protein MoaE [Dehalococcoidia bacterium]|nr:molybdenum cofactor biosynthesis protein MoaE [Dehalococcoidia bacterium]MCK5653505.1 molybdenum cofactor biosynthesis protein MoaE [Dehalococcoidia bacterium]
MRFAECEGDKQRVEQQLQEIGNEIRAKWQLEDVAICHRVGRIEVGDVIMVVAIAAPRRKEAFDACEYAVDSGKERILISEIF